MASQTIPTSASDTITTADLLYSALAGDDLPTSEAVMDFGFNRLLSPDDQAKLGGLYKGLLLLDVPAATLHQWQIQGTLSENIIKVFDGHPAHLRGAYFSWFLKNKHVLDFTISEQEHARAMVTSWIDKARVYLEPGDKMLKEPGGGGLQPEAKHLCFGLVFLLLQSGVLPANMNLWYDFGFVVCRNGTEEHGLACLYQKLLGMGGMFASDMGGNSGEKEALFKAFWKAYEGGKLIELFDSKGLKEQRERLALPHLKEFLSVKAHDYQPPVWKLKQYLELEEKGDAVPDVLYAMRARYGYNRAQNATEKRILDDAYERLLPKVDPMELHTASQRGQIFDFASKYIKLDERCESLMKN